MESGNAGMGEHYAEEIYKIAVNAFEVTCYMFPLEEWELEEVDEQFVEPADIKALVEFDGAVDGGMVITPSKELLSSIAANMLGVDAPDDDQKSGALCEMANIICGNTVPLFAQNDQICYIRPPKAVTNEKDIDVNFKDMKSETTTVYLDEGCAEITVYYAR